MSDSNLGKFLSKVLIPDLNASVEKGAKSARRTLTTSKKKKMLLERVPEARFYLVEYGWLNLESFL